MIKNENLLYVIGIMTGNSLDACDVVLTTFDENGIVEDICSYSSPFPPHLKTSFLRVKELMKLYKGKLMLLEKDLDFDLICDSYVNYVAQTVTEFIEKNNFNKSQIDLIGFHGQTCAHFPPSVAQGEKPYTIQAGDGQRLANLLDIPVVYDFRSDDIFNGGEAAPLVPMHNKHLTDLLKTKNIFPVAYLNGGNTGNISIISMEIFSNKEIILGWDIGPFNHFPDLLMRSVGKNCDYDGEIGSRGKINIKLLKELFNKSVVDSLGNNFLLKHPPKSSDPMWYLSLPELFDSEISFEDRLRTVEYFSAYAFFYSLKFIPENIQFPENFITFGGGWKNKIIRNHFKDLINGVFNSRLVLNEHMELFNKIISNRKITILTSDELGFKSEYMEARLIADMARCKIINIPFSYPSITGVNSPTVLGSVCFPNNNSNTCSPKLTTLIEIFKPNLDHTCRVDRRVSRATAGWK